MRYTPHIFSRAHLTSGRTPKNWGWKELPDMCKHRIMNRIRLVELEDDFQLRLRINLEVLPSQLLN